MQNLSNIEIKVIQLVSRGYDMHTVAEKLNIDHPTVMELMDMVYRKTNTESWAELTVFAIQNDLYQIVYPTVKKNKINK